MVVKSKQSEAGHTKLTYRCSCTESKQSPKWCTSNIDEVSYNLTNQIIEAIFQQKQTDITDYFKKVGDSKIVELKDVRNGLNGRIRTLQTTLAQLAKQKASIESKYVITEQVDLLMALQRQMESLRKREDDSNSEIEALKKRIILLDKEIAEIEAMPAKAHSQFNLSREEISDIFHQNLTQITYYPFSLMKGVYKIEYKNGATLYAIVTKVRTGAKAFLLTNSTIDLGTGDITLRWEEYEVDEPDGTGTKFSFPRAIQREKKVNILDKGLFESEELEIATLRLAIDSDFRKDYYLKSKDEVLAEAKMDE
jgi:site-specific DNA recombinase